ncbi:MAG: V-type ATPase subunit [Clostridia bacterium]
MKQGLIFANARAKAKELNLFTEERLHRMIEATTLNDAVRILIEVNYAGGMVVDSKDFYALLKEEERLTCDFVRSVAPENVGFECFFMRNDYHNIKSLLKAKYAKLENIDDLILPDGNMSYLELKERVATAKLDFNPFVEKAYKIIDKAFETGKGSPRIIDVEIDKAMYLDIQSKLLVNSDKYIKEYFVTLVDSINIASFVRVIKIGANFNFFLNNFIEGGFINAKRFEDFGMDIAKMVSGLSGTKYKDFLDKLENDDLASFETAQDNYLLGIFATNKTDMFSVAPIVGYYLAKLNEIKVIRVVLVCKKNKVPTEELRKRVRNLYA